MKVMLDTNILISAALFPKGKAAVALAKALIPPFEPLICDYILDEFKSKMTEKFPENVRDMEVFLDSFLRLVETVKVPERLVSEEKKIRDPKDRPILRAAINEGVDLFLTGDKDFLDSSINDPRIISVSDFLEM